MFLYFIKASFTTFGSKFSQCFSKTNRCESETLLPQFLIKRFSGSETREEEGRRIEAGRGVASRRMTVSKVNFRSSFHLKCCRTDSILEMAQSLP